MKTKSIVAFLIAAFMLPSVASAQFGKIIGKIGNNKTLNNNKPTNEVGVKGTAGGVNYVMTGRINHDDYDKTQTATVSFSRIPETLEEFLELQEKLGKDPGYAQPYIVAALMMGASPSNGYQPRKPYTISLRVNPAVEYKESQILGGTVLYLQVNSQGWSQNWRGAEVVKPYDSDYYLVSNCPAFYVGCAPMRGQWKPID